MGDNSKFGIECILSRIFSNLQSTNMESHTSSKSNLSESGSWDFDTMCQNTAKLDEMMLSMKQEENSQCNVGNMRKDTLARREEIAWQREEVIHTREKELREWELMLEEKSRLLTEKEKQLKSGKEKVLQIAAVHNSEKNSRKSSLSDAGLSASTLEYHSKDNANNDFVLEKENLLQEKEKVICEKIRNIERTEQSISAKEQQLNKQRLIIEKERQLVAQKNHSLDLREQVITKIEEAVETKLKVIYDEKKSLDDRKTLLSQKENALFAAAEHIQNKEQAINERENMIIEKEKNIIGQICELGKYTGTESLSEENELIQKFDEIFGEKWKCIKERENTVLISEQILQEKWKVYTEAKELLKAEQESFYAIRDTFEKEKNILKIWEKFTGKQEDEIDERSKLIKTSSDTNNCMLRDESVSAWPSPLDVQTKIDSRINKSSPFGAVGEMFNADINIKLPGANKSVILSRETSNSENREISGEELFQFYEKEKESLQVLLLKDSVDTPIQHGKPTNSEGNGDLTQPVQAFFKRISASSNESKGEQGVDTELNSKISLLSSVHEERKKDESLPDNIQSDGDVLISQNNNSAYFENIHIQDTTSAPSETSILLEESKKSKIIPSSDLEIDESVKTVKKNNKQTEIHELDDKDDRTTSNSSEYVNLQESGNVFQNTSSSASVEDEKMKGAKESFLKNDNETCILNSEVSSTLVSPLSSSGNVFQNTSSSASVEDEKMKGAKESFLKNDNETCILNSEVSSTRVSPLSSTSSSRSLTSPISGRGSPSSRMNKRKPAKDALLQAISKRNFLETVQLLDSNCMSLEIRNDEGRSAVLLAVECGNIELVERLINKGADIKACDYKGYSALHIAVTENNIEMVHLLLKKGLNPGVTNIDGNTVLQLASNLQLVTMTEALNNYTAAKFM